MQKKNQPISPQPKQTKKEIPTTTTEKSGFTKSKVYQRSAFLNIFQWNSHCTTINYGIQDRLCHERTRQPCLTSRHNMQQSSWRICVKLTKKVNNYYRTNCQATMLISKDRKKPQEKKRIKALKKIFVFIISFKQLLSIRQYMQKQQTVRQTHLQHSNNIFSTDNKLKASVCLACSKNKK